MLLTAQKYMDINLGFTREKVSNNALYALSVTDPNAVLGMLAEEAQVLDEIQEQLVGVSATLNQESERLVSMQKRVGNLQSNINGQFTGFSERLARVHDNLVNVTTIDQQ